MLNVSRCLALVTAMLIVAHVLGDRARIRQFSAVEAAATVGLLANASLRGSLADL